METRSLWRDLEAESWRRRRRDHCGCGSEYLRSRSFSYGPTVIIDRSSMAPGTSSMLRARRRDVNVKPNRVLDRNSSRGMIYENEELRLRTININAEVEKGQHDIKKLRRENDQLRREIWNLRDEYDRLEAILKSKNISTDTEEEESDEAEAEGEGDGDGEGEAPQAEEITVDRAKDGDKLSVVEEESEECSDTAEDKPRTVSFRDDSLKVPGKPQAGEAAPLLTWPDTSFIPGPQLYIPSVHTGSQPPATLLPGVTAMPFTPAATCPPLPMPQMSPDTNYFPGLDSNLEAFLQSVNVGGEHPEQVLTPGGSEVVTTAILQRRQSFAQSGDQTKDTFTCATTQHTNSSSQPEGFSFPLSDLPDTLDTRGQCEEYSGSSPSFLRLNSVQPFTLVSSITDPQLTNLSVQEVIDAMSDQLSPQLMHSLRGVRLVGGNCYLSFSSQQDADAVLALPLALRGTSLTLEDASVGATVIALSGVPHHVSDDTIAEVLSHFGSLVGPVERRVYKGVDTGERLVRLRARLAIPRWIWLEGCRVCLKILRNEELSGLSLARRKSFRSHISVQLKPVTEDTPPIPPLPGQNSNLPSIPPLPVSSNSTTPFFTTPPKTSFPSTNPFVCGSVPSIPGVPNTTESQTSYLTNASASTPNIFQESPFFFPSPFQTAEPPGIRRINSVMGTMSLGSTASPEISHARSASSPPTSATTQVKTPNTAADTESAGQTSIPPSPNTARKTAQKHKPTRKVSKISTDSRKTNGECSQTSSSDQESPQKGRRRPSSVYFKQKPSPAGILNRTTSIDQTDGTVYDPTTCSERERSNSDLSSRVSICKRKLSTTGRESGKVPWCGCWGNGCI